MMRVAKSAARPQPAAGEKKCSPREALAVLYKDFPRLAKRLCRRDSFTRDDLVQEMALALLQSQQAGTLSYFRCLAVWRARNWLRMLRRSSYRAKTLGGPCFNRRRSRRLLLLWNPSLASAAAIETVARESAARSRQRETPASVAPAREVRRLREIEKLFPPRSVATQPF